MVIEPDGRGHEKFRGPPFIQAWFPTKEEAEDLARESTIYECLYTHAVVEEVKSGCGSVSEVVSWWRHDGETNKVEQCGAPDFNENICNFGIG